MDPNPFQTALEAHKAGNLDGAERGYRLALEQRADNDDAWGNLGLVLGRKGSAEAEAALRRALDLRPDRGVHHHNLGNHLRKRARLAEAREAFAEAWRIDPSIPDLALAYGNTLLALGDRAGWAFYDERPERRRSPTHGLRFPEWQGEDLGGKRLFVWAEQGYGDQILASRFLARTAAAHVTVACRPALVHLFRQLPAEVIPLSDNTRVEPHDHWAMMMSLPRWIEGPLWSGPYLQASPGSPRGIGLAWRGNALPDPLRSLPRAQAERLLALDGVVDLDPEATGARDFAETARIVAGLDLVISVDTAVAHLAGAMGKPVLLLLQRDSADWRWEQPWYGDVEVLRQATQEEGTGELMEMLTKGELNLALFGLPEPLDVRFHGLPLFQERFVLALPANHPLAAQNVIRCSDTHEQPYVSRANCEIFDHARRQLRAQGVHWKKVFSSERDDWVQGMIKAGLGFGFFPELSITDPALVTRRLIDPEFVRTIMLITVRGRPHSPAVGAFVQQARAFKWPTGTLDPMPEDPEGCDLQPAE